jgi:hypothetical protein
MRKTIRFLVVCAALGLIAPAGAQRSQDVPRLADGTPNFSGVWQSLTTANWNIEPHGASGGPAAFGALLSTPPGRGIVDGGEIPYLPEARARRESNHAKRWTDDPELKCYMPGVPRASYMPYPFQIFQSEGRMLIAYQFAGAARIINFDEHRSSSIDSWMGVSNAHFEDDTLVVEVAGFNGQAWLDRAGNHASNALRVEERYTFAGPDAIDYEATLTDPQTFSRPWKIAFRLYRHADPDAHLMEFKCVPFTEQLLYGEFYREPPE